MYITLSALSAVLLTGCGSSPRPTAVLKPLVEPVITLIVSGDSLSTGHGYAGMTEPGYPNPAPSQAWPEVLGHTPAVATVIAQVVNTSVDGYTLAAMDDLYSQAVHPFTQAVTGKPCVVGVSIFGNDGDSIGPKKTYPTLDVYLVKYAGYLSRVRADGCKVMFLEQWIQLGREQNTANRETFNIWNQHNVDYYIPTVSFMNDPDNLTEYQPDGWHETEAASVQIAQAAAQVLLK